MRIWKRILFIFIFVIAFLFACVYAFLAFRGKSIITKAVAGLTQRNVSIGNFVLNPPLNLEVKKLNIEGLAKVDAISITPSIPYLLTGKIALNRISIVKPEIFFEKNPLPPGNLGIVSLAPKPAIAPTVKEKRPFRLIVKRLNIKDGRMNFIDRTVSPEGIKIAVQYINFNLTNLYLFPSSAIANFDLKGRIPWREGKEEGKIEAEGWLNFFKKDIQAALKIKDIDAIYLYPYYSQWVDLEKARIESASLNFSSNIQGLNNNVTADCRLELTNIVRKPRPPEEPKEKAEKITDAVLDIFKSLNQGNIVLDFTIKTKMDNPEFGFGNIKAAFEDKLARSRAGGNIKVQDVLMLPAKLIEGTIKSATDISKAVVDGTFAVGNEIKKSVEDSFKKEPAANSDTKQTDKKN